MTILLISLVACLALLAIIILIVWLRTDWKKLDQSNSDFIDADGSHAYYDRRYLSHKKKKK